MIVERIVKQILSYAPEPIRGSLRRMFRRFKPALSLERRINFGLVDRPAYAFCLYYGALTAKRLGYARISAIEFGVAGGNGIIALQEYASEITRELGIEVEIFRIGFWCRFASAS